MRHISFMLTPQQVLARTKTVTRRTGWHGLRPGTLLQPVLQGQGLRKGEKVQPLGGPIRVVAVRREPLRDVLRDPHEVDLEGFPDLSAANFVAMFCRHHRVPAGGPGQHALGGGRLRSLPCTPDSEVTRIEFEYVEPAP